MDMAGLKADVREQARRLGFAAFGVTSTRPFTEARTRALAAIDAGRMDGMAWYTRDRVEASADIGGRYPWARSIIALAWPYQPARPDPPVDGTGGAMVRGRFSAYACTKDGGHSVDYHDLLAQRCDALVEWLGERVDGVRAKRFVDHGWALDRAIAERAGVGFAGKHASVITLAAGSYVLLASIAVSVSLPVDAPSRRACGRCTACIPSCPTGAIVAPGVIDARRCISYLTIEHRGPIPHELRPLMGTWAFGCDLCQEACPINHRLAPASARRRDREHHEWSGAAPRPGRVPGAHGCRIPCPFSRHGRRSHGARRVGAELRDRARECGRYGGASRAADEVLRATPTRWCVKLHAGGSHS